ncbi:2-amino-4-hydroxy-6-hydroxymethyldihydropteridine diphosphokinase [Novilysobacter spongiicola]|uniref:2-amino-4-hydroxy-6-hydroxymethyldihydropteridine pyrophosphokinase n=1 Tax=Lysobacter spongiicola DSM 21749 TaxID=1122188 RepID=A0A1T4RKM1_9GAMM|nr:2-amino-4-hydroxy-6-hydroxymethyldihydropteridine diphosphokinase [Lysobacter spongiicola]SKA16560.1 2-amino-4-hydroxy-6-hydroxymethyldihydropteridinediphosphokinase [Lysobacter spongiicola DSM 21749]
MSRAYLSLGSNLRPEHHLRIAVAALRQRFGDILLSPVYRTEAVGFQGNAFCNAAAVIDTDLDPEALNDWLHALEDANGRDRSGPRYGDRTLDLDIVLYDERMLDGPGHLRIPRPELQHAFVLKPLADIAPDAVVPTDGRTLAQLWSVHPDRDKPFETVDLSPAPMSTPTP